jgi:hypothetical protein
MKNMANIMDTVDTAGAKAITATEDFPAVF